VNSLEQMPMTAISPTDRATQLLESPAGTVLLMMVVDNDIAITDLAQPEVGLYAIVQAVGQISPWHGHGHERIKRTLFAWRDKHRSMLDQLALAIVSQPDIAWWWEDVDRHHQVWLPQHDTFICPEEVWELRPRDIPNRFECYVHEPRPLVSTSSAHGDLSPELAHVLSGVGDWVIQTPFIPRQVTIRPMARIREILSAQDWHDFVRQYPANGYHPSSPVNDPGQPWGDAPGLMVPDWRAVSFDWDGINISPWTYLVANQVRVASDIGWTEPWAWEGPHTVWLDWMFATVEDLPPVPEDAQQHVPHWFLQSLDFSDPRGWLMMPQNLVSTLRAVRQPGYVSTMTNRVTREPFGEIDDQSVEKITLTNALGMSIAILTYGGIIQSLQVPDRHGAFTNVVLGFDNLDDYVTKSPYFGAIVGRYANRIACGRFELDGVTYDVPVNNGENSLHGGIGGFDRRVWRAETIESEHQLAVRLTHISPAGEEGYPGTLTTTVLYDLNPTGLSFRITYHATTDAPTVLNLTNHSYFNLAGEGNGTILQHVAELRASHFLPVNAGLIPTGELAPVKGTAFDFTEAHVIGERIDRPGDEQLAIAGGYDHCWVLDTFDDLGFDPAWNIRVVDPGSGRVMDVKTDQPGVQFYSGNFLDGSFAGTSGQLYPQRAGFCLETQHFPDSPNQPPFPSTVLRPGEEFHSATSFSFGVQ
jgi:aldose 1-epimerase